MFKECQLSSFLCCSHKERAKNKMIEKCIRCNKPTPYDINYPIDRRKYYIDGSGQLCEVCWNALYGSAKERLRAARKEKPMYKADFSEVELEKLMVLAPEEYELLK